MKKVMAIDTITGVQEEIFFSEFSDILINGKLPGGIIPALSINLLNALTIDFVSTGIKCYIEVIGKTYTP